MGVVPHYLQYIFTQNRHSTNNEIKLPKSDKSTNMQSNRVYFSVLRLFCLEEQCPKSYLIALQILLRLQTDRIEVLSHTHQVSPMWSWPTESGAGSSSPLWGQWESRAGPGCWSHLQSPTGDLIQGTCTSCRCTQGASQRLKRHHKMFFEKGPQQRHLQQVSGWQGWGSQAVFALQLPIKNQSTLQAKCSNYLLIFTPQAKF